MTNKNSKRRRHCHQTRCHKSHKPTFCNAGNYFNLTVPTFRIQLVQIFFSVYYHNLYIRPHSTVASMRYSTRNYAKRQVTWFKKLEDKLVVDASKSKEEIIKEIIREYNEESK